MLIFVCLLGVYCLKAVVYLGSLVNWKSRDNNLSIDCELADPLSVDIVLPMYNEEKVVVATIENLLNIANNDFSIIVVDDGSTDQSYLIVNNHFQGHPRVRLLHQQNAGKSMALNRGMNASESDIIVCIDADTHVKPDVIDRILPFFRDEKVAAVSGYIKVGNRVNLLTDMQNVEYLATLNHERRVFEHINGILVVPGALGAFRRSQVKEIGGFTSEALAEDCDITLRMLCNDFVIKNAPEAISFTEAPATLKMFIRQRVRWTVGLMQGLLKHSRHLFTQPNKALAYWVVPYTFLYRIILPVLIPLADYFLLYACFGLGQHVLLIFFLLCILADTLTKFLVLKHKNEHIGFLKLAGMEFIFRHLVFITYICILLKWFNGSLYGWKKIIRQGNVKLD